MPQIRVIIVSRYATARAGLRAMLAPSAPGDRYRLSADGDADNAAAGIVVEAEASLEASSGGIPFAELLAESSPDVLIIDAAGEWDGGARLEGLLELAALHETGAVILADSDDAGGGGGATREVIELLAAHGVPGWAVLGREVESRELTAAVYAVSAGLITLSPGIAAMPLRLWNAPDSAPALLDNAPSEALTSREREVLQLLARGLPNKQVAQRLGISLHTAKFHVAQILGRLGASTRAEAVAIGIRRGDVTA